MLTADPSLVGASWLEPAEPTVPRQSVADGPGFAVGASADGTPMVVGCAGGIDLSLVPAAADLRLAVAARSADTPRLVIAGAAGHLHPAVLRLAEALVDPAEVVALPDDWHLGAPTV